MDICLGHRKHIRLDTKGHHNHNHDDQNCFGMIDMVEMDENRNQRWYIHLYDEKEM